MIAPNGLPPQFFLIFCNRMYVNKCQRPPYSIFWHYEIFSEKNPNFSKMFCFLLGKKLFPIFNEHERHPLGVSKLFSELFIITSWAYFKNYTFLPLDMAPTLDVPVLLDPYGCRLFSGRGILNGEKVLKFKKVYQEQTPSVPGIDGLLQFFNHRISYEKGRILMAFVSFFNTTELSKLVLTKVLHF